MCCPCSCGHVDIFCRKILSYFVFFCLPAGGIFRILLEPACIATRFPVFHPTVFLHTGRLLTTEDWGHYFVAPKSLDAHGGPSLREVTRNAAAYILTVAVSVTVGYVTVVYVTVAGTVN